MGIISIAQRADFAISTARFTAILLVDRSRGVFFRSLCRALELDHSSQVQRLKRQPMLHAGVRYVVLPTRQGERTTIVLLAWAIPLWLAGLNLSRLSESARRLVPLMQEEMLDRLYALFQDTPLDHATLEPFPGYADKLLQDASAEAMPGDTDAHSLLMAFDALNARVDQLGGRVDRIETSISLMEVHLSQVVSQLGRESQLRLNDERLFAAAITRLMLALPAPAQRHARQRRKRRSK